MKVQIQKKETVLETVEVKFPIFSYIEEDEYTYYTKLTETMFFQIKVGFTDVNVTRFKANNTIINQIWWDNKSDLKQFQEGVRHLKEYIKQF